MHVQHGLISLAAAAGPAPGASTHDGRAGCRAPTHTCLRMAAANSTGSLGLASLGLSKGLSGVGRASGIGLTACAAVGVCCCWPASSVRGTRIGATSAAMPLVCDEHSNGPRAHRRGRGKGLTACGTHPPTHRQQQRDRVSGWHAGQPAGCCRPPYHTKKHKTVTWGLQQPDPAARLLERLQGGRFSTASVGSARQPNRPPALRITSSKFNCCPKIHSTCRLGEAAQGRYSREGGQRRGAG